MSERHRVLDWLDSRTGYRAGLSHLLDEPLPPGTGWAFTTGSVITLLLGIQPRGWSSEHILQAVIEYADGAREGPPQTRRWTFKMNRSPPAP